MKRAISTDTTLSPNRRSLLAGTPVAALFALAPHATLGEVKAVIRDLTSGGVA